MATLNFDARTVEPSAPAGIVPAGDYNVQIVKSEIKPTRDGQSHYLTLEFEILDGEFARRHLWANLNLWNTNETASRIAQQQLSAIGHAVGVLDIRESEMLHNKPLMASVKVKKGSEQYPDDKNEISSYAAYRGAQAMATPVATPPVSAANPFAAPAAPATPAPTPTPFAAPAPVAPFAPAPVAPAPVAPVASPFAAPAAQAAQAVPPAPTPAPWAVKS